MDRWSSSLINQISVVSGVLSTILSCGLGLGYLAAVSDLPSLGKTQEKAYNESAIHFIETAGELAFVPSILIIPFTMQKKGRRTASIVTSIPLLFSWVISFNSCHFTSILLFIILHNITLGGVVATSSIIISEYCSPRYRSVFLMMETAMLSLGVLLSHIAGIYNCLSLVTSLGIISAATSLILTFYWPESPYWLVSKGYIVQGMDSFYWLRGKDADAEKELEALILTYRIQYQLEALQPVRKSGIRSMVVDYAKSLLKTDFLKPLSIMILLFTFIGIGSDSLATKHSFRNLFKLTNGKYIGTIILDVFTLACSLTACALVRIVKRKTLFLFTGSISIVFLALVSLLLFIRTFEMFSKDYTWLLLTLLTGFAMFMSLGTTALPYSMLGEIFPMSYRGIGSSLTCAYLWAFGNSMLRLVPMVRESLGLQGTLFATMCFMVTVLLLLDLVMPETSAKTLLEIEEVMESAKSNMYNENYETLEVELQNERSDFESLQLFIEV